MADDGAATRRVAGRYRLDSLIGRGGAGAVWRGHDEQLRRAVAVKEITFPGDEQAVTVGRERALREARAAARLRDPGVVGVYDIIEEDGSAFLIMELVDAPNLNGLVKREGPMPPRAVARLGLRVLGALTAAHRAGVVHRDVKPSNVLVDGDRPKLTDFGIARLGDDATLTSTGVVLGTPAYIAPEHARGDDVGPPADLYGLGATLFYAVEGTAPFGARGAWSTVMAVLNGSHRPMRRAGPLEPILTDLLAREPEDRPSAAEVRQRLRAVLDGPDGMPTGPPAADEQVVVDTGEIRPEEVEGTGEVTPDDLDDADGGAAAAAAAGLAAAGTVAAAGTSGAGAEEAASADDPASSDGASHGVSDDGGPAGAASAGQASTEAPEGVSAGGASRGEPAGGASAGGAAAPSATPAAPRGGGPGGRDPDRSDGGGEQPRRTAVFASAIAVLLVLGLAWAARGGDPQQGTDAEPTAGAGAAAAGATASPDPSSSSSPSSTPAEPTAPASSSPEPSPSPTSEPAPEGDGVLPAYEDAEVPDDWERFNPGDAPYRIDHPPAWQPDRNSAQQIDLRDPQNGTYLRLEWVQAARDPVPDRRVQSERFAQDHAGYRNLGVQATTFKGERAALWEYRYTEGGVELHAYSLVVNDGEFGYGLNLQARQSDWQQARRAWPALLRSFRMTGGG